MRYRWLCGVGLLVVLLSLLPAGRAVPVTLAEGEPCLYANGHFTGDCYAIPSLDDAYGCDVDYIQHTYTQGCFMSSLNSGAGLNQWSPTNTGPTCDSYKGGYFCPTNNPPHNKYVAPGTTCDNLINTGIWDCWPSGPPGDVTDCQIETATGPDVNLLCSPTPSFVPDPSPSPSVPPCGTGLNLICDGDFTGPGLPVPSMPISASAPAGDWATVGDTTGYNCVQDSGYRADADQVGHFRESSSSTCTYALATTRLQQRFTVPDGATVMVYLEFDVSGDSGTWARPFPNGAAEMQVVVGGVKMPADSSDFQCGSDGSDNNTCIYDNAVWLHNATPLRHMKFGPTNLSALAGKGAVLSFDQLQAISGPWHWVIDNVVLTAVVQGGPSPSPSPSPAPPAGPGTWNCQLTSDPNVVNCTAPQPGTIGALPPGMDPPPNDPHLHDCVQQSDGHSVCQGDAPPSASPSPNPSASPNPSGSPNPSASPSPYGPSPNPSASPAPGSDGGKTCARAEMILAARIAQGVPYCWGSRDPDVRVDQQDYGQWDQSLCPSGYGLDCSAAVIWSWRQAGVNVPNATAQDLYNQLPHIPCTLADLGAATASNSGAGCWAIGDLIFLQNSTGVYHVAGYAGGNLWTDCYNTQTGCQVWQITDKAEYASDFVGAARPSLAWGGGNCGDGGTVAGGAGGGSGAGTALGVGTGQIAAALQPFYNKEPVGTVLDLANYMQRVRLVVSNPDLSPVAVNDPGPIPGAPGLSVPSILAAVYAGLDRLANMLQAAQYGPLNSLEFVQLVGDVACFFMAYRAIRGSVVLTA